MSDEAQQPPAGWTMEYLVLVERPSETTASDEEWVSIVVTATDPHAAVRSVMEDDCPLQLGEWIERGCRAWAMPWLGVTGFTWGTTWVGDAAPELWHVVPRGARNVPGEPIGRWGYYCFDHGREPSTDPRTGALTCGPTKGGADKHGHPYGHRFVPAIGI